MLLDSLPWRGVPGSMTFALTLRAGFFFFLPRSPFGAQSDFREPVIRSATSRAAFAPRPALPASGKLKPQLQMISSCERMAPQCGHSFVGMRTLESAAPRPDAGRGQRLRSSLIERIGHARRGWSLRSRQGYGRMGYWQRRPHE